jgi:hypothetical protein
MSKKERNRTSSNPTMNFMFLIHTISEHTYSKLQILQMDLKARMMKLLHVLLERMPSGCLDGFIYIIVFSFYFRIVVKSKFKPAISKEMMAQIDAENRSSCLFINYDRHFDFAIE